MYQRERDHDQKVHAFVDGLLDLAEAAATLQLHDYASVLEALHDGALLRLDDVVVEVPIRYLPNLAADLALLPSAVADAILPDGA